MKKKIILSSIVTIALCLSLITGSTFALFTSEANFNIAATAGQVKIEASLENLSVKSFDDYTHADTFENGGTAALNNNELTLMYMTPGDAVHVEIASTNSSNVDIKYMVRILATGDLVPALTIDVDGIACTYDPATGEFTSDWVFVGAGAAMGNIALDVDFPNSDNHTAQNDFQNKTANLAITLIAVQANGTDYYPTTPVNP